MNTKKTSFIGLLSIIVLMASFTIPSKYVSHKTHIKFFSTTPAEDIESHNYKAISTLDPKTGKVVFSVPMQAFEFEKALMQKHFNSKNFLDTKEFPKAKMTGNITNLKDIDFGKEGSYNATIKGTLTIKGTSREIEEKGKITVDAEGINVESTFDAELADYGITFSKGKPSTNIAKTVEITVNANYKPE